jgi:hypothetical protein
MSKQREALEKALDALDSDNPDIMLRASISIREALAVGIVGGSLNRRNQND